MKHLIKNIIYYLYFRYYLRMRFPLPFVRVYASRIALQQLLYEIWLQMKLKPVGTVDRHILRSLYEEIRDTDDLDKINIDRLSMYKDYLVGPYDNAIQTLGRLHDRINSKHFNNRFE